MTEEQLVRSLRALSKQEGHEGFIRVEDVALMLKLRNDHIDFLRKLLDDIPYAQRRQVGILSTRAGIAADTLLSQS